MSWLEDSSLNLTQLLAGFAGGVVSIFVAGRYKPLEAIGSVLVGALTANYLGEPAAALTHITAAPAGFVVGLCGLQICLGIISAVKAYKPVLPPGGNDAKPT